MKNEGAMEKMRKRRINGEILQGNIENLQGFLKAGGGKLCCVLFEYLSCEMDCFRDLTKK